MARVDVSSTITIQRPRAEVAAFASDPDNATRWYKNITSVEWETTGPVRPGSRVAFVAHFLGRRLAYTYEVRELEPSRRFVMSTAQGPFPMETTYSWEDTADGGTRMTLRNRGEPSGFSGLGAPVMSAAVRRANHKDLLALKDLLEAEGARHGQ
ncbi:SRPBCC family protein [Actinomycetospora rhizophila]|uniref:SRPBCC family protein n=1 Tax=Actinomycetospora rhizophila TaxID=1416876 RepID=A0ABV9ZM89_9PSEU